jgi:hypothetical protein
MKPFSFIQAVIFLNVKDPHSKALEPDCLSPRIVITTQSPEGEGEGGGWFYLRVKFQEVRDEDRDGS